jgi:hypothetical protein
VPVPQPRKPKQKEGAGPAEGAPEEKKPAPDKHEPKPGDSEGIGAWRVRMGTEAAKRIYKDRAATIECVNAQARNRGLVLLRVRGLAKVCAVALWFAVAHNVARGISLRAQAAAMAGRG